MRSLMQKKGQAWHFLRVSHYNAMVARSRLLPSSSSSFVCHHEAGSSSRLSPIGAARFSSSSSPCRYWKNVLRLAKDTARHDAHRALCTSSGGGFPKYTKWRVTDELLEFSDQQDKFLFRTNPILCQKHGFARVAATPPHLQRQVGMRIYQGSPGVLIDPYRVRTRFPFFKRWFTREGWQQIRDSLLFQLRTALALAKLRQITGYNKKRTYEKVSSLYKQINKAIAEGDRNALRLLVTENMLSVLKKELKQRDGVWARVHWETVGSLKLQTLQGRLAAVDREKNSTDRGIVQLTLMIISNQKFGAFDQEGKLVAGDPSKQVSFYLVDTCTKDSWFICSRFSRPCIGSVLAGRVYACDYSKSLFS